MARFNWIIDKIIQHNTPCFRTIIGLYKSQPPFEDVTSQPQPFLPAPFSRGYIHPLLLRVFFIFFIPLLRVFFRIQKAKAVCQSRFILILLCMALSVLPCFASQLLPTYLPTFTSGITIFSLHAFPVVKSMLVLIPRCVFFFLSFLAIRSYMRKKEKKTHYFYMCVCVVVLIFFGCVVEVKVVTADCGS